MAKALALAKTGLKLDCEAHKLAASKHDTNAEHFLEGCSEEEVRCRNYSTGHGRQAVRMLCTAVLLHQPGSLKRHATQQGVDLHGWILLRSQIQPDLNVTSFCFRTACFPCRST